ncbi:group 1 truncated hemoglobin [Massilia atriviolacea]|uniref:Group 1 truncated hemoglobin n=1 Tax=Massilia atriviolacea TaxID=2495579 RepID=A0A430HLF9_9BURK|nr:group 1 truncated hemoglobin [Massilia atriviolacea]RSZ58340.1 group 1 truncated hemoglobin [Massilia atriviolacea]
MRTLTELVCIGTLALAAGCAHGPAADDSTYQGLGGQGGIKKIVDTFVPLILADARIRDSFRDTDLKNLSMRLEEQFCALSGGPCTYRGKDMKEIHDGLNITNAQFNALAEDLQAAMDRHGVAPAVQNKLVARLAPMQREIVTK